MVDVLQTRLKDYCESFWFPGSNVNELEERVTANDLQRFGQEGRKRRVEAKIKDDKVSFFLLFISIFIFPFDHLMISSIELQQKKHIIEICIETLTDIHYVKEK